jgi:site-specific recombinase XerD
MKQSTLTKTLQAFQKVLQRERKHASTIKSYLNDVRQFHKWAKNTLGDDYEFADITRSDIQDFRGFLLTRNSPSTSINRRLTALRQFFEFMVQHQGLNSNPVSDVSGIHSRPQIPLVLSRKESMLFMRTSEQYKHAIETAVVLLLLHAGLRSSEICALTIGDLHLSTRESRLFIRGQVGKKMRFVYLTTRAQAAVRRYCQRRGIRMLTRKRRDEFLFTQRNGKPLTQQVIDHIIKRIGKIAGVPSVTPTMLRNTCAVQMLLNGDSSEKVARSLGMVSIKNLDRYVEELKKNASDSANDNTT